VIAADTSVLVAGFIADHRFHAPAESALAEVQAKGSLVAHTMAETYSVLSSPGGIYRVEPGVVVTYLYELLGDSPPIQPVVDSHREVIQLLAANGRRGGAIYDALIALAVRDADIELVSLDRRAKPTYELCGIEARYLDAD